MKIQHNNQTLINSIAIDNADFMVEEVVFGGLTVDETVEKIVSSMMTDDPWDETEFDAPYDRAQITQALRSALVNRISQSATNLRNYAAIFPEAYIRDFDGTNEIGEQVLIRVISFEGTEYQLIYGDDEDRFLSE